ncbi:MAG: DUF6783 domain-containing protein [Blautia faecis]
MFEKSFPQSPTNCDAHLAESLFQTRSNFLSANFTSLYNKSINKDMKM